MKPEYRALGHAQAKVAKTRAAHEEAMAELQAAEAAIVSEIERAWAANQAAVQQAKVELTAALENLARVQVEVGTEVDARAKAGRRDEAQPTVEEQARLDAAEGLLAAAEAHHEEAKERFKAGVTPEVLDALLPEE